MKVNIDQLTENNKVESVIQFGSSLISKTYRDIDICIFTTKKLLLKEKLRIMSLFPEIIDVSFYDDLPIHLKKEVLSKGKVLYTKNYLAILREIPLINDEYIRYSKFLKSFHKQRMAEI